jgi:NAD(P)H-flavin reductase
VVAARITAFQREARLCAVGRFALPQLVNAPERLDRAMIREDGDLVPVDWDEALATVAERLKAYSGEGFVAIVGETETRETRFLYERFTREVMRGRLATIPAGGDFAAMQPEAVKEDLCAGRVKAALVAGAYLGEAARAAIEYLVVADFLPSATSTAADAVLPVTALSEVEGTFRRSAGEVRPLRPVGEPPSDARPEWEVIRDLARAMEAPGFEYRSSRAVAAEIDGDAPPAAPSGRPRDTLRDLPTRYRGHLLADWVPGLAALSRGTGSDQCPVSSEASSDLNPQSLTLNPSRAAGPGGFRVVANEPVVPNFYRVVVEAPAVARHARAGQFVIVMVRETSERVPFTLADWDAEQGTITLIVEEVGRSSQELVSLRAGDRLAHVTGPLGVPLPIENVGTVALGGGCYGIGAIYHIARAMKEAGNHVIAAIEGCSHFMLYFEEELRRVCDAVRIATKDGSRGTKGGVQELFRDLHERGPRPDLFVAVGCTFMMRMVAEQTRSLGVPLQVALNPIMVDGTGMCGACRVTVGSETRFACVDGPFFDGHAVDWDPLFPRRDAYVTLEVDALPQTAVGEG